MNKVFKYDGTRVRFQDVDHAGIAFFAKYYEYCHIAYEEFVEDVLGLGPRDFFEIRSFGAPLVATGSEHFHPLRHGDRIQVTCWLKAMGNKSMTMGFHVDNQDGVRCASMWTKHAFVDGRTMRSIPIPDELREKLRPYLQGEPPDEGP